MTLFDRYPTMRKVIVNTRTDRAFRGVLWRKTGEFLVLRSCEMLKGKDVVVPMDGEVMIERVNVDFMQVL